MWLFYKMASIVYWSTLKSVLFYDFILKRCVHCLWRQFPRLKGVYYGKNRNWIVCLFVSGRKNIFEVKGIFLIQTDRYRYFDSSMIIEGSVSVLWGQRLKHHSSWNFRQLIFNLKSRCEHSWVSRFGIQGWNRKIKKYYLKCISKSRLSPRCDDPRWQCF